MPDSINRKRMLQSVKASARKGIFSAGDAASEKARSDRDATMDGVKAVAESSQAQDLASASGSAARIARDTAARARRFAGEGIGSAKERVPWGSVVPDEARDKLVTAIQTSKTLSGGAKRKMIAQLTPRLETLFRKGLGSQAQIFSILQTSLAIPEASYLLNAWLQDIVKGTPTIYDKAMDAAYNSTRIGGGDHRLFDGGHTIAGAFQAVRNASPDDSIFEEAAGFLQALARDATTPRGLPLVTWDQETFNGLTDALGRVGIPRAWVVDMAQLRRGRIDRSVARSPRDSPQLEQ